MKMGRRWAGLAVVLGLGGAILAQGGAPAAAGKPAGEVTAAEQFKNIQVLKNIPASQLLPTMRYITVALGVRCSFCHVEGNFASDAKPHKMIARHMMEMVFAINKNHFNNRPEISCYTCHRGSSHPEGVPPMAGITPAAAPSGALPSADQIVANYITAVGGQEAIAAIHTVIEKGTLTVRGQAMPLTLERAYPDKGAEILETSRGEIKTWFNAGRGWRRFGDQPAQALPPSAVPSLLPQQIHAFEHLRVVGTATVEGQPAYRVIGQAPSGAWRTLYFSQSSSLLLADTSLDRNALGALAVGTLISDYRPEQGVQMPFAGTDVTAEGSLPGKLDSIQVNPPVPDSVFAPPTGQ